eukprot:NODE_11097_length_472_cov_66.429799_g10442_i0.p1 GENE.NODE_11097_length_472_cov_66.429799_g10442_i0~~NODE_11097_length_472_cov_66.429799_g10442_i0.p1  ORF type:complete len:115 (-),score=45.19 NODE_11097_length_472_cov_66.429799_g10442_i0:64-408(-)
MKHLAALLLLQLGGNAHPSKAQIEAVIAAGGGEPEGDRINFLLKQLEGKDVDTLIKEGLTKISSVGVGGGSGGSAPAAAAATNSAKKEKKAPTKEKKKAFEEEKDGDMGFGFFD